MFNWHVTRIALLAWAALFGVGAAYQQGCSSEAPVRARIVDVDGDPVSGALLYFEVYRSGEVLDFGFAETDERGFAPPHDTIVSVPWGRRNRLAMAAFAPGKKPTVLQDALGTVTPEGMVITVRDLEHGAADWEPRVAQLGYPFENDPALFGRAAAAGAEKLREAFEVAYEPLVAGGEAILPAEEAKMEGLDRLRARSDQLPRR